MLCEQSTPQAVIFNIFNLRGVSFFLQLTLCWVEIEVQWVMGNKMRICGTPHCERSLAADWCSRGFNCTLIARVGSDQLIGQESTFSTHFIITLLELKMIA